MEWFNASRNLLSLLPLFSISVKRVLWQLSWQRTLIHYLARAGSVVMAIVWRAARGVAARVLHIDKKAAGFLCFQSNKQRKKASH